MSFVECKCPNCSLTTVIDDSKISCYCIYCAHSIKVSSITGTTPASTTAPSQSASSTPSTASTTPELATVYVNTPSQIGYEFVVYLNGREVLRTIGGTDPIKVSPGKYEVKVKCSVFSGTTSGYLREGSRILASAGFMGLKVSISG